MAEPTRISDEVKTFIVRELACYDPPSVVAASVKEEFGIDISRQAVQAYDPTKRQGKELSEKLRKLFEKTRKRFDESTDDIPISKKAVRLKMYDRSAQKLYERGNYIGMKEMLESAAREVGDAYTNKQKLEHTGKDGQPLPAPTATIVLSGRPEPQSAPAPKAVARVRKSGD